MSASGGAGLAAEAGREAGVAQRQPIAVEDLAVVQRRERHLRGADQEQLIVCEPVDLLLSVGQEPGPEQRAFAHEHRRDHSFEAALSELVERPRHERQLESHERAFQIRETGARHVRRALDLDHRPGEIEMVARLILARDDFAGLSDYLVLGPGRGARIGQVGKRRERCVQLL